VDPYSVDAIADGLAQLLEDAALRESLVAKGLQRAGELTWAATVEQTRDVYRSVLA
jgi:glycosyltransferase involved in cell wall biosynthesis